MPFSFPHHLKPSLLKRTASSLVEANMLWKKADYGKDTILAVLDTGCDRNHPGIKGKIIDGYNFTADYKDPFNFEDNHYHGTHVAGSIVGEAAGFWGVAPGSRLLIVKVIDQHGRSDIATLIRALSYVLEWRGPNKEKVDLIVMSLGSRKHDPALYDIIRLITQSQILIIAAAGNQGDGNTRTDEYSFPGAYSEVVQVGAVDENLEPAYFSNCNAQLDLVAQGLNIYSTVPKGFAFLSGTSCAVPMVAGVAALLSKGWERDYGYRPTVGQLKQLLFDHTIPLEFAVNAVGHGLIHATKKILGGFYYEYY